MLVNDDAVAVHPIPYGTRNGEKPPNRRQFNYKRPASEVASQAKRLRVDGHRLSTSDVFVMSLPQHLHVKAFMYCYSLLRDAYPEEFEQEETSTARQSSPTASMKGGVDSGYSDRSSPLSIPTTNNLPERVPTPPLSYLSRHGHQPPPPDSASLLPPNAEPFGPDTVTDFGCVD